MNTQTATVSRGAKLRGRNPARAAKKAAPPITRKAKTTGRAKPVEKTALNKQDKLVALLSRPEGATIADLTAATGWQAHSVRGAMSGALKKKLKLTILSEKAEGKERTYRIGKEKSA